MKIHHPITGVFVNLRHRLRWQWFQMRINTGTIIILQERFHDGCFRNLDKDSRQAKHRKKFNIYCSKGTIKIEFNVSVDSNQDHLWSWINLFGELDRKMRKSADEWKNITGFYIPGTHNNNAIWTDKEIHHILECIVNEVKKVK